MSRVFYNFFKIAKRRATKNHYYGCIDSLYNNKGKNIKTGVTLFWTTSIKYRAIMYIQGKYKTV